jgi:hypothetical protein
MMTWPEASAPASSGSVGWNATATTGSLPPSSPDRNVTTPSLLWKLPRRDRKGHRHTDTQPSAVPAATNGKLPVCTAMASTAPVRRCSGSGSSRATESICTGFFAVGSTGSTSMYGDFTLE